MLVIQKSRRQLRWRTHNLSPGQNQWLIYSIWILGSELLLDNAFILYLSYTIYNNYSKTIIIMTDMDKGDCVLVLINM